MTNESYPRGQADLAPADLEELAAFARQTFDVRDRTYANDDQK